MATSGEVPWWAWALLLLAVAACVGGAVLLTRRRRAAQSWDQALDDVEDAAKWLHDRVLPPVLADSGPSPSAVAWSAARPRFLTLDEQLTALTQSAPDAQRRATAIALRSALAETATALDGRAAATSANTWAPAQTQAELAWDRLGRVLAYDVVGPPQSAGPPAYPPPAAAAAPGQPRTTQPQTTSPKAATQSVERPTEPPASEVAPDPHAAGPMPPAPPAAHQPNTPELDTPDPGAVDDPPRGGRHAAP